MKGEDGEKRDQLRAIHEMNIGRSGQCRSGDQSKSTGDVAERQGQAAERSERKMKDGIDKRKPLIRARARASQEQRPMKMTARPCTNHRIEVDY
jgi:hypothetical protein